jgi:hypothetical protein
VPVLRIQSLEAFVLENGAGDNVVLVKVGESESELGESRGVEIMAGLEISARFDVLEKGRAVQQAVVDDVVSGSAGSRLLEDAGGELSAREGHGGDEIEAPFGEFVVLKGGVGGEGLY